MINKNDCFANMGDYQCHALKEKICNTRQCPFYKPKAIINSAKIESQILYYSDRTSLSHERIKI